MELSDQVKIPPGNLFYSSAWWVVSLIQLHCRVLWLSISRVRNQLIPLNIGNLSFFCFLPSFIKLCRGPFSYDLFSLSNRCYDNYKIILFLFSWKPLLEKQTDSTNHVAYPWQYRVKYFTQERLPQRCILCPITFHAHRSSVSGQ